MHPILTKLLKKRGIKDVSDLKPDEKETFDNWNRVLTGDKVTVEKIGDFCRAQISLIESKWNNLQNSSQFNDRLITQHVVYKTILNALFANDKQREDLERHLNALCSEK